MQYPQPQSLKTNMALTFLSTLSAVMIAVPVAIYVTANFVQPRHSISAAQLDQALATAKPPVVKTASMACEQPTAVAPTNQPGLVLSSNTGAATTNATPSVAPAPSSSVTNHYHNTNSTSNDYDYSQNYYDIKNDVDITNNNTIKTTINDIIDSQVNLNSTITNHNDVDVPTNADAATEAEKAADADKKVEAHIMPKPLAHIKKPAVKKPLPKKPKTALPVKVEAPAAN